MRTADLKFREVTGNTWGIKATLLLRRSHYDPNGVFDATSLPVLA